MSNVKVEQALSTSLTACQSSISLREPSESMMILRQSESLVASVFSELIEEFGGAFFVGRESAQDMLRSKVRWAEQIHDLTPEQIQRALSTMPVGRGAYPPGPRAFRKLALAPADAADRPMPAMEF